MHILLNIVNTDSYKSVDALFQFFMSSLLTTWGMLALLAFIGVVSLTIFFDLPKWVWLTVAIYVSALGFSTNPSLDNQLAAPLQQIRPFNRPLAIAMLVLLLIPTIKASRGQRLRLMLRGTVAFFIFELVFSARFMIGEGFSRGSLGLVVYLLVFAGFGVGLSRWLQAPEDVYTLLRCVLVAGCLTALGTAYQLTIRPSAVLEGARLLGTTNNPQHLGTSMAFMLPVACFILLRRQEQMFWRVAAAAFGGVAIVFILWTQSRSAVLVAVVALLLFFRTRLGKAVFAAASVGIMLLIVINVLGFRPPGVDRFFSTLDTRSNAWTFLWGVFKANPLLGSASEGDSRESSYLSSLALFGLIGSLPLGVALFLMAKDFLRLQFLRRSLGEHAQLVDLVLACLVAMLMLGCFESYLLGTATDYLFCFYIFLAIGAFLLDPGYPGDPIEAPWSETGVDAEWNGATHWQTAQSSTPAYVAPGLPSWEDEYAGYR